MTASPCTTSSPTTTSTTRRTARTTATATTTTRAGTAASRARPTIRRCSTLRARQKRNLLATLFLSQGVPMLLAGDEIGNIAGRQQQRLLPGQRDRLGRLAPARIRSLVDFVARVIELRKRRSALSRPEFLTGARNARGQPDVSWFSANGQRMTAEEWNRPHVKCLTVRARTDAARVKPRSWS